MVVGRRRGRGGGDRVTKVKGHATDEDVEHGRVRLADKVGNAGAAFTLGFLVWLFSWNWLRLLVPGRRGFWMPLFAMIPKADGDSTPLGQAPGCPPDCIQAVGLS